VFPIRCLGCGKYDVWLCSDCVNQINPAGAECPNCRQPSLDSRTCPECRNQSPIDRLFVWSDYQNPLVQKSIHVLKYGFVGALAKTLGRILAQLLPTTTTFTLKQAVVIPVPLHWQRRNERGFNQTELLAISCAETLNLPCLNNALRRLKYTVPQATQSRHDRLTNLSGLFKLRSDLDLFGKIVIIIDDVPVLTPGRFS